MKIRILVVISLLVLPIVSCTDRFDKNRFLAACQFSIEDNILSDADEYNEVYSDRWRTPEKDSLYKLFVRTHNYELNLKICHSYGKGYFLRSLGRGVDSLLDDNFFARAIKNSCDRDEIIKLVLINGWDKPYSLQKIIGEECLKEKYYVNDSLKYIALNYAIDGNCCSEDFNIEVVRDYCKEKMRVATSVFGCDSYEAYNALFECSQFTQIGEEEEFAFVDSLFRYHKTHDKQYSLGLIENLYHDPLYMRYISSMIEWNFDYAYEILNFLTDEILNNEEDNKFFYDQYVGTDILLMYENARIRYILGDSSYQRWIEAAAQKSITYLSPTGGYTRLADYLEPDHDFLDSVVDLMEIAYNTPIDKDAYDIALFIKGTSALIAPDMIRMMKSRKNYDLINYVDSLRQNYRGFPFTGKDVWNSIGDDKTPYSKWSKRESYYEKELDAFLSLVEPNEVWKSSLMKFEDVLKALEPNESAVEIIKTFPLPAGDDVYYAIIANYGNPVPVRKKICDGPVLEQLIHDGHFYDNTSSSFYDNVIEPLLADVTGSTVYLSPVGLLSIVNMPYVSNGHGMRVSDKWDIRTCISTKSVCDNREKSSFKSIALFGGLEYEIGNRDSHFSKDKKVLRDVERAGFGYLPASLDEVEAIDSMANSHNISTLLFTGGNGTESEFRSLSGKDVAIIHLATHGFYYNTQEVESGGYINVIGKGLKALNRCGLILADSRDAWLNGIDRYDNDNGVMLGSEIANLDLLNTELVVLSACNTGLGDISNEGISGLQQAFKRAGVQKLLLSLKPVSDDATKLFMIEFYKHLFEENSIQQSFDAAVEKLKLHPVYSDPDYWTSYILLT